MSTETNTNLENKNNMINISIKNINDNWFDNVLKIADNILRNDFHPCEYALHNYDQFISANTLIKKLLN